MYPKYELGRWKRMAIVFEALPFMKVGLVQTVKVEGGAVF